MRRPARALASLVAACAVAGALHAPCGARPHPDDRAAVLRALNAERAVARRRLLRFDERLARVAQDHAADMARPRYFGHVTPEGVDPFGRMRRAGYRFRYAGENIALDADVPRAHAAIWNEPRHRAIVLQPAFGRVGIGVARTRDGVLLVEDFSD